MKLTIPSDLLVGQYLQFIALHIAAAIAATYALGYVCGRAIHNMNATITDFVTMTRDDKVALIQLTTEELTRLINDAIHTTYTQATRTASIA